MRAQNQNLADIATSEFHDIFDAAKFIGGTHSNPNKLRLSFHDSSFLDIWLSVDGDYAYHWERRGQTGEIFRWDNAPHHPQISTHPNHLHKGDEGAVVESHLSASAESALREILRFVQKHIKKQQVG